MLFNENIKSLYIHVPFCSSKCSYCDFFSLANKDFQQKKSVIESTVKQIKYYSQIFSFNDIETVYIGGGTPTALPPSLLEYLIFSVYDLLNKDLTEFSIEINPETVDEELVIFFQRYSAYQTQHRYSDIQRQASADSWKKEHFR